MHWYLTAKRAQWQNLAEVRTDFRHADAVGLFTVFNIGGNKYRLITAIKYRWQIIYIRHVLTHAEYSMEKWKSS
jgi:mRNA interferase HigB